MPVRLLAAACALVLAVPAVALAQGAGDDQYADPFGSQTPPPAPTSAPSAPSAAAPRAAATPSSSPSPAVVAAAGTPAAASASASASTATAAATAQQLPRTGADAWQPAVAGAVLLASGVALRRRLRPR